MGVHKEMPPKSATSPLRVKLSRDGAMVTLRRGTTNVDRALRRREKTSWFSISTSEFARRKRFVDTDGNTYAIANAKDRLYKRHTRNGRVCCAADDNGLPIGGRLVRGGDGTRGREYGRTLLFSRKPRQRSISPLPRGEIQMMDTETGHLFTARVDIAIFHRESKSGHVIVDDMVDWGAISDPSLFGKR